MINANELRIGNLVGGTKDYKNYPSAVMVVGITNEIEINGTRTIYVKTKGDDKDFYTFKCEEKLLYPIPITPDILNKIDWDGYVKLHINSYFSLDDVGHLYYSNDYTGININYLHQLQNIYFSLTNNELNIEGL